MDKYVKQYILKFKNLSNTNTMYFWKFRKKINKDEQVLRVYCNETFNELYKTLNYNKRNWTIT